MDPFYVAFAAIRLLVHLTSLVKINHDLLSHSAVWFIELIVFLDDAKYVSSYTTESGLSTTVSGARLIKDNETILKCIALLVYLVFDNIDIISHMTKQAYNHSKLLAIVMAYTVITAFTSGKEPDKLFEDELLTEAMVIATALYLLFLAWTSDAGKQPSFLIFGCLFTHLPLSSMLKHVATALNSSQLLSSPLILKVEYIVLHGVARCGSIIVTCVLEETRKQASARSNSEETERVRDVEKATPSTFDRGIKALIILTYLRFFYTAYTYFNIKGV
ncbi:hypothetical protein BJV82DRAFT_620541 [Fennellomyces sp. T-0311]|nr:hypothetical protein BJV82DRAFT_620541 [Fennellomyces sp. T-0311]